MTKPLSVDLRSRVVAAVEGGLSRRQAAARFGVSISSAIRWTSRVRTTGDIRPLRVGGDKRSARIEGFAPVILGAVDAKPDITLAELRELLAEHGASFALSTIWRFFARHKITLEKVSACCRAGASRRPCAASFMVRRPVGPRSRASDLHRRDGRLHQDGAAARAGSAGTSPAGPPFLTDTGKRPPLWARCASAA